MEKTTPLLHKHETLGARMVPFAGWMMPVMYASIQDEVEAVRTGCGVFDISHMGRFFLRADDPIAALSPILSRDLSSLKPGRQRYSLLLNEQGGIIDDLMVLRMTATEVVLVANAGNTETDFGWLDAHLQEDVELLDRTEETVMLALQGPMAQKILEDITGENWSGMSFLDLAEGYWEGIPILISRSGYTGEDGFELICPVMGGIQLWETILQTEAKPCGLGARDLLRLEMGYPLHGHEISPTLLPSETGLMWAANNRADFVGKQALTSTPPRTQLIGFTCVEKSIPRPGMKLEQQGTTVGAVSSGGLTKRLPMGFGMAHLQVGVDSEQFDLVVRDKRIPVRKTPFPFVPDQLKRKTSPQDTQSSH